MQTQAYRDRRKLCRPTYSATQKIHTSAYLYLHIVWSVNKKTAITITVRWINIFNCHNPTEIKLITRHLREHKFRHNSRNILYPIFSCGKNTATSERTPQLLLTFSSIFPIIWMKEWHSSITAKMLKKIFFKVLFGDFSFQEAKKTSI